MGGASSKGGAAAGRAARKVAKAAAPGKTSPSAGSHLPADDDLLTKFKPTKGEARSDVVRVSTHRHQHHVVIPGLNRCLRVERMWFSLFAISPPFRVVRGVLSLECPSPCR